MDANTAIESTVIDDAFERQLIESGYGLVVLETSGEFIPQMLNMDLLDGISFDKGCYTGQEVIARLKYKGEVKRRCYRFTAEFNNNDHSPIETGTEVIDSDGKTAGTIAFTSSVDSTVIGLAVLKTTIVEKNIPVFIRNTSENDKKTPCLIDPQLPPYAINN